MSDETEGPGAACESRGAYLLGALRADAVDAFERHLAGCAGCQEECDGLGPLVEAIGALPPADVRALLDGYDPDDDPDGGRT